MATEQSISHHLSFFDLLRLSTRIFTVKPARTFLTILGTSVGIATVVFLVSLGYGLQYILLGKLVTTEDSLITLTAFYPTESALNIEESQLKDILELPAAAEVSPLAEFSGEISQDGFSGLILVRIIEPNYFRLAGLTPDIGTIVHEGENGIVVTNQALRLVNLKSDASSLGKEVPLKAFFQSPGSDITEDVPATQPLRIRGIITDDAEPPIVFVPGYLLKKQPSFFKEALVKAKELAVVEPLRDRLIEKGFLISARLDLVRQAQQILTVITITLGVFGVAALIVSAIGMFNTMIVGFLERIYEVGVMKAIGATDRDVRNLFLAESVIMGLAGGGTGIILGMGGGQLLNFGLRILAARLGGKPFDLFITPLWFVGLILGLSAFIGIIAGFWPARRAIGLSPKEAFKSK
ncbi:MAG: hypothetical protein A3A43_00070 [Candidatus Liptonbacteria bacterium RIFCSPLOWO2_01_FULL_56_20]|uniref:ABC3 transporter permease protein domain-containing protein n=1 Tax=Candidatus Liptonbacteria bacterium RIFCSPLOWO2_01_FULL_56_20 TaxID=1798652 RepID=A0A1G2CLZ9_9BACT|nr:MAG: hypothetical protein A2681_02305 [Candidatus Liptonbacteria bacterium RIFCSPHIGHO2_01_FULL_56_18b]OGZ01780.1 MAG: hypothetical protein A3A43_00070 [Candidatus Liptonbacteria bacterium RIFCSPLOWO2_01_FULL_56_20]